MCEKMRFSNNFNKVFLYKDQPAETRPWNLKRYVQTSAPSLSSCVNLNKLYGLGFTCKKECNIHS